MTDLESESLSDKCGFDNLYCFGPLSNRGFRGSEVNSFTRFDQSRDSSEIAELTELQRRVQQFVYSVSGFCRVLLALKELLLGTTDRPVYQLQRKQNSSDLLISSYFFEIIQIAVKDPNFVEP